MNDEIKIPDIDPNDPEAVAKQLLDFFGNLEFLFVHRIVFLSEIIFAL